MQNDYHISISETCKAIRTTMEKRLTIEELTQ